nr:PREDICTED: uncharacterized protein LOC105669361 [Linepithema humile]
MQRESVIKIFLSFAIPWKTIIKTMDHHMELISIVSVGEGNSRMVLLYGTFIDLGDSARVILQFTEPIEAEDGHQLVQSLGMLTREIEEQFTEPAEEPFLEPEEEPIEGPAQPNFWERARDLI